MLQERDDNSLPTSSSPSPPTPSFLLLRPATQSDFRCENSMAEDGCAGSDLLKQLELILETDRLIDEIGFLHPSQFLTLAEDSGGSPPQHGRITKSAAGTLDEQVAVAAVPKPLHYDKTVLWCSNHKLAISLEALSQLYRAAMLAYKDATRGYEELINSPDATIVADGVSFYEKEILKHSEVLLILSCDFSSAWNSRKLILSRKNILSLFMDEFQLSKLILSYSPKSDYAWSHRRWVMKMIGEQFPDLQEIVEAESELVKEIAEKSKMNYRAWKHRCWLVPYMAKAQLQNELNKSRKWAELHIGDNCCFHYRRQLMLRMLENSFVKKDGETSFHYELHILSVWKDELQWNELLIQRYIGREALWVHRRFLSQCWIKHFCNSQQTVVASEDMLHASTDLDLFLGKEWQFLITCQNISVDEFEDTQVQAQHAASYILWILKQLSQSQMSKLQDRLRVVRDLKVILIKACPEKTMLWESLSGQLQII